MNPDHASPPAPLWRCVTVWLVSTAAAFIAGAAGVQASLEVWATPPHLTTFDEAVVGLAGVVATATCAWLWVLTTWGVADALRGRVAPPSAGRWRRLTMAACGCAAAVSIAVPAHAGTSGAPERPDVGSVLLLDGLPYPDRPTVARPVTPTHVSPTRAPDRPARAASPDRDEAASSARGADTHVVREGDTLWSLATDVLAGADATSPDVAATVARIHRANRSVIGADPDLIVPGQRLTLTPPDATHREDLR